MTVAELSELLLVRLYDLSNAENSSALHDLYKLCEEFGEKDNYKIDQAAKVLSNRGLILASFHIGPGANGRITGEGSLFVEEGGNTSVISQYRENPSHFLVVDQSTHFHGPVSNSNVAVSSPDASQSIDSSQTTILLNEIHETLVNDQSLNENKRAELLGDVDTLRAELARGEPRQGVLKEILSTLGDVASIAGVVGNLAALLGLVS